MRVRISQNRFHWLAFLLLVVLVSVGVSGCAGDGSQQGVTGLDMAPLTSMPVEVQKAPVVVQQAYQFAAANPAVLEQLPCYCGCGPMGHESNYACYISGENADGSLAYDAHALGCSICVDITQDAMRMLEQGKTVPEIRSYVDNTYSKFGPSNMP